jgi:type I restriction enzyme S subunit
MPKTKTYAQVAPEEMPYALPDGWEWVWLGDVVAILNGFAFKSESYVDGGIRIIRIANVQDGFIEDTSPCFYPASTKSEISKYMLFNGDLLVSLTGNVGRVAILEGYLLPAALNQRVACLRKTDCSIEIGFIYYFLLRGNFAQDCIKSSKGTAQLNMSTEWLKNYPIPLPPLPVQRQIVANIESLFAKLDRARELAQSAVDAFDTRRAAILHRAFTGELTAKWRRENDVDDGTWKEKPLSDLCDSFQYGTSKKSEKDGDVAVLRMGNLQKGEIYWKDLAYTTDEGDIRKYSLKTGDVLFNRTNSPEHVGKTSVYREEVPAIFAGYLIRINYKEELNGYYLNYVMNSQRAREYCSQVKSDGVNQSNINAKKLAAFTIPHCSLPEQQEIVRILDGIFAQETRAKELADCCIGKINLMKKAILARAFWGELG